MFENNRHGRDCFGDTAVVGDMRWTGKFGISADLVARDHCSVEFIRTDDIKVRRSSVKKEIVHDSYMSHQISSPDVFLFHLYATRSEERH